MSLRCYFCGAPIKGENGCLDICDEAPPTEGRRYVRFNEHGGRVEIGAHYWPGTGPSGSGRVVVFTHYGCGSDCGEGYWVPFDRLESDWEQHLSEKRWWTLSCNEAVAVARAHVGAQ